MAEEQKTEAELNIFAELVKDKPAYLFCDACGFYPIEPVHGHFVCPSCLYQTRCCDGAPLDG